MWLVRDREELRMTPRILAWEKERVTIHQGEPAGEERRGWAGVLF